MGERPAERITLAGPAKMPRTSIAPGVQTAAFYELRSAAATYDYLRSTGDPVEFWEALRLARNKRGLVPPDGSSPAAPDADQEALLRQELDSTRERFAELVGALRDFLQDAPDLPKPDERLEFALAFLMASPREHEAVAQWLREPDKHRSKAAQKIRGLAAITDPYLEALKPWSLGG